MKMYKVTSSLIQTGSLNFKTEAIEFL